MCACVCVRVFFDIMLLLFEGGGGLLRGSGALGGQRGSRVLEGLRVLSLGLIGSNPKP